MCYRKYVNLCDASNFIDWMPYYCEKIPSSSNIKIFVLKDLGELIYLNPMFLSVQVLLIGSKEHGQN